MKKFLLLLPFFLLLFGLKSKAQLISKDTADFPYWIEMMQDESVNFYTVQHAFNLYYAKHHDIDEDKDKDRDEDKKGEGEEEEDGFAVYKRWEYVTQRRIHPDGSRITGMQVANELLKYDAGLRNNGNYNAIKGGARPAGNPTGNWSSVGPTPLPKNTLSQPNGMGRINAIAFDPVKKGTIYVGSAGGGMWVTSDSGTTWGTLTDGLSTLGVSAIAIDPNTPATIYIGTGDRDNNDAPGLGVMKSINGGTTWTNSNTGMGGVTVTKILINPSNTAILLAATSAGIFRSVNSGATWSHTSSNNQYYKDIAFKPKHPNVVYATASGSFYRSKDGGLTFTQISGLGTPYRGVIGVTPADTNRVYFVTSNFSTYNATFVSTDGGTTFRSKSTTPNIMDYADDGSGSGGQAWYDFCVVVDTVNKGTLYVGGINVKKSVDSGATWTTVAHWVGSLSLPPAVIHADQHFLTINPLNNKLYVGNDGGIYSSADKGVTWNNVSNGITISEIYKIGQSATRPDLMLAGFQDNGTSQLNNGKWNFVLGGDGMECAVDPKDTNVQYGEIYYGDIYMSSDAGKTFYTHLAGKGTNGVTDSGAWVTPYVVSKSNANAMFAGYHNIWRCLNTKATTPVWTKISNNLGTNADFVVATEQSSADTNVFYFSRDDDRFFVSSNINAVTPTWSDITSKLPNNVLVVDVKTHPKYPNTVYIIQNQSVYISNDKGITWKDITGSLPAVAKSTIVIDKNSYSALYIGTDLGVYYRDSSMTDWVPFKTGLPTAIRVMELEIYYDAANSLNNKIKAGTYGRGAWVGDLFTANPVTADFTINNTAQCLTGNSFVFTDASTVTGSTIASWSWDFGDGSALSALQSPKHTYTKSGNFTIKLIATSALGSSGNTAKAITVYPQSVPAFNVNSAVQCFATNSFSFTDKSTISSGSITKWNWDFGDLTTSTSQNPGRSYTTSNKFKVILKVTSNNGCIDTISKQMTVNPQPTAAFSIGSGAQCLSGNSFAFSDLSTVASGSISGWAWDFGDLGSSASKNPTHVYQNAGTYTVKLTATTNNGCTDVTTKSVTVYAQSNAAYSINATTQCLSGNSYVFTDNSSNSSGSIANWTWDFGDGNTAITQNATHVYATAGTFKVRLKVTSNNGCIDSVVNPMNVWPQPVSGFTSNGNNQCIKTNSYVFTDKTTVSLGGISQWTWNFGDGNTSTIPGPANVYAATGTYTVKLKVKSNFGCFDSTSQTMVISPQPVAAYTIGNASQCLKANSFVLTDKSTVSSGKINVWTWDPGDGGNTVSTQSPAYVYKKAGTFNIKLKVTTANACSDSLVKPVTVYPTPVVSFTASSTGSCLSGNSFSFTDKSTVSSGTLAVWGWDFGDGTKLSKQNSTHSYSKAGSYKVVLTVTSNNNCSDTVSKIITVYPQTAVAFLENSKGLCLRGNSFNFTDNSVLSSGKIAAWAWNFGDVTISPLQNPVHVYSKSGTFAVKLKTTTDNGCIDSTADTISVYAMPKPAIFGDTIPCARGNIGYSTKNDTGSAYNWTVSGGTIVSGAGTSGIKINWPTFASGSVHVLETNTSGCKDSAKMDVLVKPTPVANITTISKICAGKVLNILDSSTGADKYYWDFGDSASAKSGSDTSSAKNPSHIYANGGKYTVKVFATNALGCTDSSTKIATVISLPDAHWKLSYLFNQAVLHANDSTLSDTSYHWNLGDGTKITGHSVKHVFPLNTSYSIKLTLSNANGCVNEFDTTVTISKSGFEKFENKEIKLAVFPNPFQSNTTVAYDLVQSTKVNMMLYDVTGKEVASLINETQPAGNYTYEINSAKYNLVPGVYFLKVMLNDQFVSKHIVKF